MTIEYLTDSQAKTYEIESETDLLRAEIQKKREKLRLLEEVKVCIQESVSDIHELEAKLEMEKSAIAMSKEFIIQLDNKINKVKGCKLSVEFHRKAAIKCLAYSLKKILSDYSEEERTVTFEIFKKEITSLIRKAS